MPTFEQAFNIVVGSEGGLSTDPCDPGNWTGGKCGRGFCRGTKFGISAFAYPDLDIPSLTREAAATIYRHDYWNCLQADMLPPALALLVFDAAVNSGVERAVRWLQLAVGVSSDGHIGPTTIAAVRSQSGNGAAICADFLALRLSYMASLPTWQRFGYGWARRLCRLPYESLQIGNT